MVDEKKRSKKWILFALMVTMSLAAIDITIVATSIPEIVADLSGLQLVSWVFSIYLLAQTITIPVYGKLSDLYGRKPILMVGTTIFLIGSVACAASWNMTSLIWFRALQGLGAGAILATVATLAGDLFTVKERAAIQGWLSSVWGISAILGPLIGGALSQYASWHWIFLINLPVGALSLFLIAVFVKEAPPKGSSKQIDFLGAFLIMLFLGALTFGLLQGGLTWPWLSWQSAVTALVALLAFAAMVQVENRAEEPIMPPWLWQKRVLVGPYLASMGIGMAMMAPNAFLPLYLQSVHSLGAIAAGFVLASMSIGWPVMSSVSGRFYMRIGFRDTALMGAVLGAVAPLLFLLTPTPRPIWAITLSQIILGAGFGLMSTPLLVGIQSIVGWSKRGVVTSASMFSRNMGQSVGAAIFGAIFNATLTASLREAPSGIAEEVPRDFDGIMSTLHTTGSDQQVVAYLKGAVAAATQHLYLGVFIIGVAIIAVLLATPRWFKSID